MIALDCDIYMFCPKYQLPVSAILNDVLRAFVVNLLSRTLNLKKKKKKKENKIKEKEKEKKAVQWPTLGHSLRDNLINPLVITAFVQFRPEGHWDPRNEFGSLSSAEGQVGLNWELSDSNCNALSH